MADYHSLIARAVSRLDDQDNREQRAALCTNRAAPLCKGE